MKKMLISLSPVPPPGFIGSHPAKKDLLVNCLGLHADSLDQALAVLKPYIKRIYGVVLTPGETFSNSAIGPNLWHVTFSSCMTADLKNIALSHLDMILHVFETAEENRTIRIEHRECKELLNSTRIGYNEAADKLMANIREIRLLRDYLSSIIDSMPSIIIGINLEREVTLWNKKAEMTSGIHKKDAEGKKLDEAYPFLLQFSDLIDAALTSRETSRKVKTSRTAGHVTFHENITVFPLISVELGGAVIVIDDVSRLVRLEQNLAQSQKMDAIGQLAGGVAHDFNNMLGGILGSADVLLHRVKEENKKFVDIIIDSAEKAADLTGRLLIFGHKGTIERKPLTMSEVLGDTISLLERTLDKKIDLSFVNHASDDLVEGNSSLLQNLFLNLGINAGHAMPDGGEIIIKMENKVLDKEFHLFSQFNLNPGRYVEIVFKDTGSGIPAEHLEHIFEPFFTTKSTGKGAGLGLASAYKTIQDHGGAISVSSRVSFGTEFVIYLPLSIKSSVQPGKKPEIITGSGTILLIDDENNVRLSVGEMLKQLQYSVLAAANGMEGVNIYRHNSEDIVLVILDMIMPRMNGYETLLKLREINKDVRVVISSGYTREKDMELLAEAGINGFIRKPYRLEELGRVLSSALEK